MNKNEFITISAEKANLSKKDMTTALQSILDTIQAEVANGGDINFIGFGSFKAAIRSARTARVPGTDKTVDLPETQVVKFKVGKSLKDAVAEGKA